MCNLCTHDEIIERFCAADSQELRIFIGFAQSDDPKAVVAATGALATLLPVPEIGERFPQSEKGIEAFVETALNPDSEPALHRAAVGLKALFVTTPTRSSASPTPTSRRRTRSSCWARS